MWIKHFKALLPEVPEISTLFNLKTNKIQYKKYKNTPRSKK